MKSMKERGIPLDGVGLQMHVSIADYPPFEDVSKNIARLGALGLEVHITEMDVVCSKCNQVGAAAISGKLRFAFLPAECALATFPIADRISITSTDLPGYDECLPRKRTRVQIF